MRCFAFPAALSLSFAALLLTGCSGGNGADEPAETTEAPTTQSSSAETALPENLFVAAAPDGVTRLIEVKTEASVGDQVTFQARVGGRKDAFVANRAVFFVADPSLLSCEDLHADACKTPWDYCCEPPDNLRKHMATVQVVDGAGMPIKLSLEHEHGLDPLDMIVVTGTVAQIDDAGNFVVNAETIHVQEG